MRDILISSLAYGFSAALAVNLVWSLINRASGRRGQNFSFIRFGSFIRTGLLFSVLALFIR